MSTTGIGSAFPASPPGGRLPSRETQPVPTAARPLPGGGDAPIGLPGRVSQANAPAPRRTGLPLALAIAVSGRPQMAASGAVTQLAEVSQARQLALIVGAQVADGTIALRGVHEPAALAAAIGVASRGLLALRAGLAR